MPHLCIAACSLVLLRACLSRLHYANLLLVLLLLLISQLVHRLCRVAAGPHLTSIHWIHVSYKFAFEIEVQLFAWLPPRNQNRIVQQM